jgi:hypothetical protein
MPAKRSADTRNNRTRWRIIGRASIWPTAFRSADTRLIQARPRAPGCRSGQRLSDRLTLNQCVVRKVNVERRSGQRLSDRLTPFAVSSTKFPPLWRNNLWSPPYPRYRRTETMLFGLFTPGPWEMVILGVVFVLLFPGLLRRLCRGFADSVNIIRATFDRGDAFVAIEDPYLPTPESIWPTAFRSADTQRRRAGLMRPRCRSGQRLSDRLTPTKRLPSSATTLTKPGIRISTPPSGNY